MSVCRNLNIYAIRNSFHFTLIISHPKSPSWVFQSNVSPAPTQSMTTKLGWAVYPLLGEGVSVSSLPVTLKQLNTGNHLLPLSFVINSYDQATDI